MRLQKWQREWQQFKHHCTTVGSFDWVRAEYAHNPTEFFRLRDDRGPRRCHLVFMTTGCFSLGLQDPWIKLAFIRLARKHTKLSPQMKRRIGWWAASLVRQVTSRKLTSEIVEQLMKKPLARWSSYLVQNDVISDTDDDPVPELLARYEQRDQNHLDWKPLCEFLRNALPAWKPDKIKPKTVKEVREKFTDICRALYESWLTQVPWKSPLLILDEAHHAKNDTTRLAKMFRNESEIPFLKSKFRRMLFLTATPFQLGHEELVRILRTFVAVLWSGDSSPSGTVEEFRQRIDELEKALDANRLAGKDLDQLWGKITSEMLGNSTVEDWWARVEGHPENQPEKRLCESVLNCKRTRTDAEKLIRPWVIRHNRSPEFPKSTDQPALNRRETQAGRSMIDGVSVREEVLSRTTRFYHSYYLREPKGNSPVEPVRGHSLQKAFRRLTKHFTTLEMPGGKHAT